MGHNIRIHVTSKDIENGTIGHSGACPIALAARRAGLDTVSVDHSLVDLSSSRDGCKEYKMPLKAQKFVDDFDSGKKVKPFSFTLTT